MSGLPWVLLGIGSFWLWYVRDLERKQRDETYLSSEVDFSGRNAVPPEEFDRMLAGLHRGALPGATWTSVGL
jgi:hypothetical protein